MRKFGFGFVCGAGEAVGPDLFKLRRRRRGRSVRCGLFGPGEREGDAYGPASVGGRMQDRRSVGGFSTPKDVGQYKTWYGQDACGGVECPGQSTVCPNGTAPRSGRRSWSGNPGSLPDRFADGADAAAGEWAGRSELAADRREVRNLGGGKIENGTRPITFRRRMRTSAPTISPERIAIPPKSSRR